MQDMETGFVSSEPSTLDLHASERAHIDVAIRGTAPRASPVFKLGQLDRCLLDEVLDDILLAEPVAAAHGVVEVIVETVVRALDTRRTTLGRHGVAAHRVDLGDQSDFQ